MVKFGIIRAMRSSAEGADSVAPDGKRHCFEDAEQRGYVASSTVVLVEKTR